mgnify:CR=1 FL=1
MKIWEIEPESNIILKITINGQYIDLPTIARRQENDGIVCDAIRLNGKVVSISSPNISVELMYIRINKSPVVWKGVACDNITYESRIFYKIRSRDEGAEKNRREAFRLFLGCHGVAQVGTNKKAINVTVKDVSETGFSFITNQDMESVEGTPVRLVFYDMENQFSLMGLVVRKVSVDEESYIYGCKLSVNNSKLSRYIVDKQRNDISKSKDDTSGIIKGAGILNSAVPEQQQSQEKKKSKDAAGIDPELYNVLKEHYKTKGSGTSIHERAIDSVEKEERREVFRKSNVGKRF